MATLVTDIADWFDSGVAQRATHLVVICDTPAWEGSPVYVMQGENARQKIEEISRRSETEIVEVYDLSMDKQAQLQERRVLNY